MPKAPFNIDKNFSVRDPTAMDSPLHVTLRRAGAPRPAGLSPFVILCAALGAVLIVVAGRIG